MGGPLTVEQIREFKDEGVLVLRGLIPKGQVAEWRGKFWDHIRQHYPQVEEADSTTWPDDFVIPGGFSVNVSDLPQMKAVVQQLGGGRLEGGMGGTLSFCAVTYTEES